MMPLDHEKPDLQARLRALGRVTQSTPPPRVLANTTAAAVAAMRAGRTADTTVNRWLIRVLAIMAVTLPIPALFLWLDWSVASALMHRMLPAGASAIATSLYLWMKMSLIGMTYMLLIPLLVWFAVRVRVATGIEVRQ